MATCPIVEFRNIVLSFCGHLVFVSMEIQTHAQMHTREGEVAEAADIVM